MRAMLLAASLTIAASTIHADDAAPLLSVTLADGSVIAGHPDARSDGNELCLRRGSAELYTLRHIPWKSVTGGEFHGRAYEGPKLKKLVRRLKSKPVDPRASEPTPVSTVEKASPPAPNNNIPHSVAAVREVVIINSRVENKSLVVHLRVRQRRPASFQGTLRVDLIGLPHGRRNFAAAPGRRTNDIERLANWTRRIQAADFQDGEAIIRFPLRQGLGPKYGDFGFIKARLTLPGHGTFASSMDGVPLRAFSPVRDAVERRTGRRDSELLGR